MPPAKDATKHAWLLVKTTTQLAERGSGLVTPLVAACQDIDGKLGQQKDRIKNELEPETEAAKKKVIVDNIRMKLAARRDDAVAQATEAVANPKELLAAARILPSALANDEIKKQLDRANTSIDTLQESGQLLEEAEQRADTTLPRLPQARRGSPPAGAVPRLRSMA